MDLSTINIVIVLLSIVQLQDTIKHFKSLIHLLIFYGYTFSIVDGRKDGLHWTILTKSREFMISDCFVLLIVENKSDIVTITSSGWYLLLGKTKRVNAAIKGFLFKFIIGFSLLITSNAVWLILLIHVIGICFECMNDDNNEHDCSIHIISNACGCTYAKDVIDMEIIHRNLDCVQRKTWYGKRFWFYKLSW